MSKTKTARLPDPRTLARAIVDSRLEALDDWYSFMHGPGGGDIPTDEEEQGLVSVILAEQHPEATTAQFLAVMEAMSALDSELSDLAGYIQEAHGIAGFLVGLELGRRIGGGR